jgi:hypothetical protein
LPKKAFFILILAAWLLIASAAICPPPAHASGIMQIALVLDSTGSIGSTDWGIIVTGVATAVVNNVPHDGTVELTVVVFSTGISELGSDGVTYQAHTYLTPTIITAANSATLASTVPAAIIAIPFAGGSTSMADGVSLAWLDMAGSTNFVASGRQVINLATDGVPNIAWACTTCAGYTGDPATDVTAARNLAVAGGLDELDGEGIGASLNINYMRDSIVWPQPGTIAPPFTPGWVQPVADATAFANAMANKFQQIIQPKLTVIKHVINDNGGTMTADKFSITVTGTNVAPSATFPGAESPGTTVTLDAGSYSVDEAAVAGYTKTLGADCSGTIANGESKTCTITNDDNVVTVATTIATTITSITTITISTATATTSTLSTSTFASTSYSTTTAGNTVTEYVTDYQNVIVYVLVIASQFVARAVGGLVESANRLSILAPYLALLGIAAVVVAVSRKKRKN